MHGLSALVCYGARRKVNRERNPLLIEAKTPLAAAMHRAGKSGRQLADELGVTESQVSRWRNGLLPSKDFQRRIAKKVYTPMTTLWP